MKLPAGKRQSFGLSLPDQWPETALFCDAPE